MPTGETTAMRFEAIRIPGAERAVSHVRRWCLDQLGDDHPVLDDALLCLSELVTNAMRYTDSGQGGQVHVELGFSERAVRVEVLDDGGSTTVPCLADVDEAGVSGRGLRIVSFLASAWGAERRGRGHAVWFELRG